MTADNQTICDEAIAWHVRLNSVDADWDAFTRWLEQGPEFRDAYASVSAFDADLGDLLMGTAAAIPINDNQPIPTEQLPWYLQWRRELAATLVFLLAVPLALVALRSPTPQLYQSPATAMQTIALRNGSEIVLDRASRLTVIEGEIPQIELLSGAAWFAAPADPDQSFAIRVGKNEIYDMGTQFSLSYGGGQLEVAVAHGRVAARFGRDKLVTIARGEQLFFDEQRGEARVGKISAGNIAAWRSGRLIYNDAPLALVAADLARHTGQLISVDAALAAKRFSGALDVGTQSDAAANLALILGAETERRGNEIRLVPGR